MYKNKESSLELLEEKRTLFNRTVNCVDEKIFKKKAPPKTSITVLEAILVGVGKNLGYLSEQPNSTVKSHYQTMISHEEFSEGSLREGLSKKQRVISRLKLAARIFSGR
jgi:hypothetical protein